EAELRSNIDRLTVAPGVGQRFEAVVGLVADAGSDIEVARDPVAADDVDGLRFTRRGHSVGGTRGVARPIDHARGKTRLAFGLLGRTRHRKVAKVGTARQLRRYEFLEPDRGTEVIGNRCDRDW